MTVNHLSLDSPGALPGVATIQVPLSSFGPRGCDSLSYNQANGKGSKNKQSSRYGEIGSTQGT